MPSRACGFRAPGAPLGAQRLYGFSMLPENHPSLITDAFYPIQLSKRPESTIFWHALLLKKNQRLEGANIERLQMSSCCSWHENRQQVAIRKRLLELVRQVCRTAVHQQSHRSLSASSTHCDMLEQQTKGHTILRSGDPSDGPRGFSVSGG